MARGKRSYFICQQSGFKLPYRLAKKQWNGLIVGPADFDTKHPQLTPPKITADGKPLPLASPDVDDDGGVAHQLSEYFPGTHGDRGV